MFKIIDHLCKQYPIPQEKEDNVILHHEDEKDEKNDHDVDLQGQVMTSAAHAKINEKYLCPITNKIMKDPVIAFDGCCYEKEAIIKYIKENKKSPKTGQVVYDVKLAITSLLYPNNQLKQEMTQNGIQ